MDYQQNYYDYIKYVKEKRKDLKYIKNNRTYEGHHIMPKSSGGTGDSLDWQHPNIVPLTYREHYLAHYLLWKFNPTQSTAYAFRCMNTLSKSYIKINSRLYAALRRSVPAFMLTAEQIEKSKKTKNEKFKNGLLKSPIKNRTAYNNGTEIIFLEKTDDVPPGFIKGGLKHSKELIEKRIIGYQNWVKNNPEASKNRGIKISEKAAVRKTNGAKHWRKDITKYINMKVRCIETNEEFTYKQVCEKFKDPRRVFDCALGFHAYSQGHHWELI